MQHLVSGFLTLGKVVGDVLESVGGTHVKVCDFGTLRYGDSAGRNLHLLVSVVVADLGTDLEEHVLHLHSFVGVVVQQFAQELLGALAEFGGDVVGNADGFEGELLTLELVHDFLRAQLVASEQEIEQQRPAIPDNHLFKILICEIAVESFGGLVLGVPDVDGTGSIGLFVDF